MLTAIRWICITVIFRNSSSAFFRAVGIVPYRLLSSQQSFCIGQTTGTCSLLQPSYASSLISAFAPVALLKNGSYVLCRISRVISRFFKIDSLVVCTRLNTCQQVAAVGNINCAVVLSAEQPVCGRSISIMRNSFFHM